MALEIKLSQKLSQTLTMTPQLQQAIKLLQLGRLEYQEAIEKELLENPILEELHEDDTSIPQKREKELRDTEEAPIAPRKDESPIEWEDYLNNYASDFRPTLNRNDDEERPSLEATVSKAQDLSDHILSQICVSDLSQTAKQILWQIIGNLNSDGYLCITDNEIAHECNCEEDEIKPVLELVQSVDPAGLAAHDLKECLLLQLDRIGLREGLAAKIISSYLPQLEKRQYEQIAKLEKVELEKIYSAIKMIKSLEPRPGRQYTDDSVHYIVPDIYIIKDGNDYIVSLNEDGLPKLRLNLYYLDILNKDDSDPQSHTYLNERFKAASWLIKSIHQRQNTIYRVTESIVKFQRDFLDKGISYLKPLILKDIASDIGMHESTVSRVTTNKYVQTPQGIFELKYFFTTGLKAEDGSVSSSSSIKEKVRNLISSEDPKNPISDQQIVDVLTKENINIARRTVAKYRESLGILSSSKRKKVF